MTHLDANIFLRFLAPGDEQRAMACKQLFERIDAGQIRATTSEAVIAEVVFVLTSRQGAAYGLRSDEATARLRPLLMLRGLRIPNKNVVLQALDVIDRYPSLDFTDALIAARVLDEGIATITSYDRDFDRIEGISRVEPGDVHRLAA